MNLLYHIFDGAIYHLIAAASPGTKNTALCERRGADSLFYFVILSGVT